MCVCVTGAAINLIRIFINNYIDKKFIYDYDFWEGERGGGRGGGGGRERIASRKFNFENCYFWRKF